MKIQIKYMNCFFIIVLFFRASGCDYESFGEPDSEITIVNNSEENIIYFTQYNMQIDTSLSSKPLTIENSTPDRVIIKKKSLKRKGAFIALFKDLPDKVLMIYFFSYDTIAIVSWEEVVKEYKVLARYDLTLEDLERLNWTIYYPPNEKMKEIKMYYPKK